MAAPIMVILLEVIAKPVSGVALNQPGANVGRELPPFSKGGQGGLNNRLIIPLNPPLEKGDLKPPFPNFCWLRAYLYPKKGFEIACMAISRPKPAKPRVC
jgi:hypothetical protein